MLQDRDKTKKDHLADAVEGLKRYNARRKLKGAVQALAGAVSLDCPDSDSNFLSFHITKKKELFFTQIAKNYHPFFRFIISLFLNCLILTFILRTIFLTIFLLSFQKATYVHCSSILFDCFVQATCTRNTLKIQKVLL